jgi:hypothetical protein
MIFGDFALVEKQKSLAGKYFKKAVRLDPDNADAVQKLLQMGDRCNICLGSGICYNCHDAGICLSCNGTGGCKWCKGDGKIGLFGKQIKCIRCKGDGFCQVCEGQGKCPHCKGSGKCPSCNGLKVNIKDI